MARQHAAELLEKLVNSKEWPSVSDRAILKDLYLYAALREADDKYLAPTDWDSEKLGPWILDPLGQRIPQVWADMVFGEDPKFEHPAQANVDAWVEANDLSSELQTQEETVSSEGETWWRIYKDDQLSDFPIIDWHSRTTVYPYFRGRRLVAVAFISVIQEGNEAWRYVECHAETLVLNRLYKVPMSQPAGDERSSPNLPSSGRAFGNEVPLTDRPETEDIEPDWDHGLKHLLCGRVLNKRGRTIKLGVSDYQGKTGLLTSLSAAANIGDHNMHLTARKRAVVDSGALTGPTITLANGQQMMLPGPEFDSRESVFVRDTLDETLGGEKTAPFQVLEYDFDASALETYIDGLTDRILTRCRVAPQLVGRHTESAQTGPALRARLLDSVMAAQGKGRFWDGALPDICRATILVDNLPTSRGGFGRSYQKIDDPVSVQRTDPLPQDEQVEAQVDTLNLNAGIISRKTVITKRNPEWDENRVQEELDLIDKDEAASAPPPPPPPPDNIPPRDSGTGGQ